MKYNKISIKMRNKKTKIPPPQMFKIPGPAKLN